MQRPQKYRMVGRAGFEPAYRFREPNLQSGAISHSTTYPRLRQTVVRAGVLRLLSNIDRSLS